MKNPRTPEKGKSGKFFHKNPSLPFLEGLIEESVFWLMSSNLLAAPSLL